MCPGLCQAPLLLGWGSVVVIGESGDGTRSSGQGSLGRPWGRPVCPGRRTGTAIAPLSLLGCMVSPTRARGRGCIWLPLAQPQGRGNP